jgi:hypothetical protein
MSLTVNGKGGDSEDGPVDLHELGDKSAVLLRDYYTSSNSKVTIKPRVPDSASVGLHTDLEVALGRTLGDRPNLDSIISVALARNTLVFTLRLGLST